MKNIKCESPLQCWERMEELEEDRVFFALCACAVIALTLIATVCDHSFTFLSWINTL